MSHNMNYWINIHDPQVVGKSRQDQCKVYLQKKSEGKVSALKEEDLAFIYETHNLSGQLVDVVDDTGRRRVRLGKGRKGIIALVRITSSFNRGNWEWNGIPFIGYFDTQEITCKRNFVSLDEINMTRRDDEQPLFNPRINGGLRQLKPEEFQLMSRLIGFK